MLAPSPSWECGSQLREGGGMSRVPPMATGSIGIRTRIWEALATLMEKLRALVGRWAHGVHICVALLQWSMTFVAPWTRFVEDWHFFHGLGWRRDGLRMIQVHYIYCAFYFYYYYVSSLSDHQALDPGDWVPLRQCTALSSRHPCSHVHDGVLEHGAREEFSGIVMVCA